MSTKTLHMTNLSPDQIEAFELAGCTVESHHEVTFPRGVGIGKMTEGGRIYHASKPKRARGQHSKRTGMTQPTPLTQPASLLFWGRMNNPTKDITPMHVAIHKVAMATFDKGQAFTRKELVRACRTAGVSKNPSAAISTMLHHGGGISVLTF